MSEFCKTRKLQSKVVGAWLGRRCVGAVSLCEKLDTKNLALSETHFQLLGRRCRLITDDYLASGDVQGPGRNSEMHISRVCMAFAGMPLELIRRGPRNQQRIVMHHDARHAATCRAGPCQPKLISARSEKRTDHSGAAVLSRKKLFLNIRISPRVRASVRPPSAMAAIDVRRYSHRMPKISDGSDGVNIAQSKSALQPSILRLAPKDTTPHKKIVSRRGQQYPARSRIDAPCNPNPRTSSGMRHDSPHALRESRRKLPGASAATGSQLRAAHARP